MLVTKTQHLWSNEDAVCRYRMPSRWMRSGAVECKVDKLAQCQLRLAPAQLWPKMRTSSQWRDGNMHDHAVTQTAHFHLGCIYSGRQPFNHLHRTQYIFLNILNNNSLLLHVQKKKVQTKLPKNWICDSSDFFLIFCVHSGFVLDCQHSWETVDLFCSSWTAT